MQKERKPIFQRSLIPKIFFIIISLSLVITLNIIKKNQKIVLQSETIEPAALLSQKGQEKALAIPEVNPHEINDLTLFVCNDCPYCSKVTTFINQEKLEVPTKNVEHSPVILKELMHLTKGRKQVPCLKMGDNNYLFESSEIIKQLKYVRKEKPTLLVKKLNGFGQA